MKKLIIAAVAAATAITGTAAPALANPFNGHGRPVVAKQQDHRWSKGQRFDSRYARDYKVIGSPRVMTWMRRSFAACFVGLGARLALQQQ